METGQQKTVEDQATWQTLGYEVTAQDIERGIRYDCLACPHALAICRALGVPEGNASIGAYTVELADGRAYALSLEAKAWINWYDQGRHVVGGYFLAYSIPNRIRHIAQEQEAAP